MIVELTLEQDKKTGKILSEPSDYNPSEEVKQRTAQVMRDFANANLLRNKPYMEFNMLSLTDRLNLDQMSWNQFVTEPSNDPSQQWRSRAFRPIVRNKCISTAAHITASVIYPNIFAQNDNDEEDRDAAIVMRELMEWVTEEYGYDKTFIYSVIAALVNPCCFIHTEYRESFRKIKEIKGKDKWEVKEILDEVFSGFQSQVIPVDQMWIADFYIHDIQKQPYLIWRRILEYATAKEKYQGIKNFDEYVRPGLQYLYTDVNNTFYRVYDQQLRKQLVEEVIYYNRSADLQLRFVNGILMDDVDQPNPRQDKMYPFAKTGYEIFDGGRFFYYKSLVFKLAPDEEVINTAYRMLADGSYIQAMPPAIFMGDEAITSAVIAPGMVTTLPADNPNQSFQTIQTNNNLGALYNLLEKVEASVNESSTDTLVSGQQPEGQATAFEISRVEQNARIMLGLFAKMIGFMVKDLGKLMVSDILQFLTVGQVMELENESTRLKFPSFLLPEKTVDGKTKTRKIQFDQNLPDQMDEKEMLRQSIEIAKEENQYHEKMELYKVNPTLFRNLKFRVSIRPEALTPKSDALKKALALEEYGLAMNNPFTNKEAITRDLLLGSFESTKGDTEKYMAQQQDLNAMTQMNPNNAIEKPPLSMPFNMKSPVALPA